MAERSSSPPSQPWGHGDLDRLGKRWAAVYGSCRVRVRSPQGGATSVPCWYQPLTVSGCGRLFSWLCPGCQCCQTCRSAAFGACLWVVRDENFSVLRTLLYFEKSGRIFYAHSKLFWGVYNWNERTFSLWIYSRYVSYGYVMCIYTKGHILGVSLKQWYMKY